jgi:hypothetical protein
MFIGYFQEAHVAARSHTTGWAPKGHGPANAAS